MSHHGHPRASSPADVRRLAGALGLILGLMAVEVVVGILASSLALAALMVRSGYGLVRASGRVFLEAAPEGVDPNAIGRALAGQPGVVEVHDLHIWEVTSGFPALSAHVLVGRDTDCHAARRSLEHLLYTAFDIEHTTLQVEHEGGELLQVEVPHGKDPGR